MTSEKPVVSYEECNKQGVIFSLANRLGHDLSVYAERYLRSRFVSGAGDFEYAYYQIAAPSYSLDLVDAEELQRESAEGYGISNDEAYWIGYFYKYLGLSLGMENEALLERFPFDAMRALYAELGTLPKEEAEARLSCRFTPSAAMRT